MESRSCREFVEKYKDARVNCATCVKWDKVAGKCGDDGVRKRYEDTPDFDRYNAMMQDAKDIIVK